MNKLTLFAIILVSQVCFGQKANRVITKQGQITFFSYTSVEDIEASNNQVLSIVDLSSKEVAISMLMRTFVFRKALMQEHFNESYIESDVYPKATFEGEIQDFDISLPPLQTKLVKGKITIHGVTKEVEIKAQIEYVNNVLVLSGNLNLTVADFKIKIPPIVAGNIAKTIQVKFRFEYQPYEN